MAKRDADDSDYPVQVPRTSMTDVLRRAILFPLSALLRTLMTDYRLSRGSSGLRVNRTVPVPLLAEVRIERSVFRTMQVAEPNELESLRADLKRLLDVNPDSRRTMRHLVHVEAAIGEHGLDFIPKVPDAVLAKAHAQLEVLMLHEMSRSLAVLRSRMSVALIQRSSGAVEPIVTGFSASALGEAMTRESDAFADVAAAYAEFLPSEMLRDMKADFAPTMPPPIEQTAADAPAVARFAPAPLLETVAEEKSSKPLHGVHAHRDNGEKSDNEGLVWDMGPSGLGPL